MLSTLRPLIFSSSLSAGQIFPTSFDALLAKVVLPRDGIGGAVCATTCPWTQVEVCSVCSSIEVQVVVGGAEGGCVVQVGEGGIGEVGAGVGEVEAGVVGGSATRGVGVVEAGRDGVGGGL